MNRGPACRGTIYSSRTNGSNWLLCLFSNVKPIDKLARKEALKYEAFVAQFGRAFTL